MSICFLVEDINCSLENFFLAVHQLQDLSDTMTKWLIPTPTDNYSVGK